MALKSSTFIPSDLMLRYMWLLSALFIYTSSFKRFQCQKVGFSRFSKFSECPLWTLSLALPLPWSVCLQWPRKNPSNFHMHTHTHTYGQRDKTLFSSKPTMPVPHSFFDHPIPLCSWPSKHSLMWKGTHYCLTHWSLIKGRGYMCVCNGVSIFDLLSFLIEM